MTQRLHREFGTLWEQTRERIRAYMFCACSNPGDADDLAQECYLRALRNWDRFEGRGSRQAWLFTIARNTQVDWFRRRKRQARLFEIEVRERSHCLLAATLDLPAGAREKVGAGCETSVVILCGPDRRQRWLLRSFVSAPAHGHG